MSRVSKQVADIQKKLDKKYEVEPVVLAPRVQPKAEPKTEPKVQPKPEPTVVVVVENPNKPKVEQKIEEKVEQKVEPDETISVEIGRYAYLHLMQWGYLQSPPFQYPMYIDHRLTILQHFGMTYAEKESGDPNWRNNLENIRRLSNKDRFSQFMRGTYWHGDKALAEELRQKMLPTVKKLGVWMAIYDALGWRTRNEKKALDLLRAHADDLDLGYEFHSVRDPKELTANRPNSDSLLSYAIKQGNATFTQLLLDVADKDELQLDKMCELAIDLGQWHIYQKLELTRMGRSVFERIEREKEKIEKSNAIVDEFMKEYDTKEMTERHKLATQLGMNEIVVRIIRAIENRKPISEEMLLIAWRTSAAQHKDPLDSDIWRCLQGVLSAVLQIPLDKLHWSWFQLYLLNSGIWFEKLPDERLLYEELVRIVEKQWQKPKDYLKKHITKIEDTKEWKGVIDIEDQNPKVKQLRQDERFLETAKPVRAKFGAKQLRDMSLSSGRNIVDFYDMSTYLSGMVIRAYELDVAFHDTMKNIFNINPMTNKDPTGNILYTGGPVKTRDRCQAKAQNDYSKERAPTTASIVDIIRGSLVFKDVAAMLDGFDRLLKAIQSGEHGIKKVIRLKNTLRKNEKKRREKGVYRYGDIKLNVLVEKDNKTIIGEIQLMTRFILEAKKLDHELYEIVRRKPFIVNVKNALTLAVDKHQNFVNAVIAGDVRLMSTLFVNHPHDIDIHKLDDGSKGYGIIHRLCVGGNYKGFALLMKSMANKEDLVSLVTSKATNGDTPLMVVSEHCATSGHYTILCKLLDQYGEHVNVNHQNEAQETALYLAAQNGRVACLKKLLSCKDIDPNIQDRRAIAPIMRSVQCRQVACCAELIKDERVDVNRKILSGSSPLIIGCFRGFDDIVELFLNCPRTDFNYQRPSDDCSALMWCNRNGHTDCVRIMCERPFVEMNGMRYKVNRFGSLENTGYTAITCSAGAGHYDCVAEMLKRKDCDVNLQIKERPTTPLIEAAREGQVDVCRLLLEKSNIDVNLKDDQGKTALDLAKELKFDEITELLIKKAWT